MSEEKGTNWGLILRAGGLLVAILVFFFGSGWIYNTLWKNPSLAYTLLPGYDMGDQYFTGIVVENRGSVTLEDVEVILSELESEIVKISMPGPHQSVDIINGGEGTNNIHAVIPRFSQGAQLPIYMITKDPITLGIGETLYVTSTEVVGKTSEEILSTSSLIVNILVISVIIITITIFIIAWRRERILRVEAVSYNREVITELVTQSAAAKQKVDSAWERSAHLDSRAQELELSLRANEQKITELETQVAELEEIASKVNKTK